jgi:hypothetical protein
VVSGSSDLRVVIPAFEECALAFTTQGRTVVALAGQLGADCAPLGDPSVGGSQCVTLSEQVTTLVHSLDSLGTGGCTGIVQALERILAAFEQVDQAQAANPRLVPQPGGG